MIEKEAQSWPGDALQSADHPYQSQDKPLLPITAKLEHPPTLRQPNLFPANDQLERQQRRDDLEHMRGAAGGKRKRRHAEQKNEQDREALLSEEVDQGAQ